MAMRFCKRLTVRGQKISSLECKHTDCVAICLTRAFRFVSFRICFVSFRFISFTTSVGLPHLIRNAVLVFTSSTQQMLAVVHHVHIQTFSMFPLHLQMLQSVAASARMARRTRRTRQFLSHEMLPLGIWKDANLILPTEHLNIVYRVYWMMVAGY